MGAGGSQEASYDLRASVPAGTYHFVLDAVITGSVDVQFDLIWRRASGDVMLATWGDHYEPLPDSFDAQPFEYAEAASAVDFATGDQLVFRYTGANATVNEAYIPNGDGEVSNGRIPHFTLPH